MHFCRILLPLSAATLCRGVSARELPPDSQGCACLLPLDSHMLQHYTALGETLSSLTWCSAMEWPGPLHYVSQATAFTHQVRAAFGPTEMRIKGKVPSGTGGGAGGRGSGKGAGKAGPKIGIKNEHGEIVFPDADDGDKPPKVRAPLFNRETYYPTIVPFTHVDHPHDPNVAVDAGLPEDLSAQVLASSIRPALLFCRATSRASEDAPLHCKHCCNNLPEPARLAALVLCLTTLIPEMSTP